MSKVWVAAVGVVLILLALASASESVEFWGLTYDRSGGEFKFQIENVGTEEIELNDMFLFMKNDNGDTIDVRFPSDETLYRDDILDVTYDSINPFFQDSCDLDKKIKIVLANESDEREVISTRYKYVDCNAESLDIHIDSYPAEAEADSPFRIYGTVEKDGVRATTAKIIVQTSWGESFTDYSTDAGTFLISFLAHAGKNQARLDFSWNGYNATRFVEFNVDSLKLEADAYPRTLFKGNTTKIIGKVSKNLVGVSGAIVEITVANTTVTTTANSLGQFSKEITVNKVGDVSVQVFAHKNELVGEKNITLLVKGSETGSTTINVPAQVTPGASFRVSGVYLVDGQVVSKTIKVKFLGETYSAAAKGGSYYLYLTAPKIQGCYPITVETVEGQVCVGTHSRITLSFDARTYQPGENGITYTAKYEDGSPVIGTLFYGFGPKQGSVKFNGSIQLPVYFGEGRYYSFGQASDGLLKSDKVVKEITIGNPKDVVAGTPTKPGEAANGSVQEEQASFSLEVDNEISLFAGETKNLTVGVKNLGKEKFEIVITLDGAIRTVEVGGGKSGTVQFPVTAAEDKTMLLKVEADGSEEEKEITVVVKDATITIAAPLPSENGTFFINYAIEGFGARTVFEKLTDVNGTIIFNATKTLTLPAAGSAALALEDGEYNFCVSFDDMSGCKFVRVRSADSIGPGMGLAIFLGVLALLLMF